MEIVADALTLTHSVCVARQVTPQPFIFKDVSKPSQGAEDKPATEQKLGDACKLRRRIHIDDLSEVVGWRLTGVRLLLT